MHNLPLSTNKLSISFQSQKAVENFRESTIDSNPELENSMVSESFNLHFSTQDIRMMETFEECLADWLTRDLFTVKMVSMISAVHTNIDNDDIVVMLYAFDFMLRDSLSKIFDANRETVKNFFAVNSSLRVSAFIKFNMKGIENKLHEFISAPAIVQCIASISSGLNKIKDLPNADSIRNMVKAKFLVAPHVSCDLERGGVMRVANSPEGGIRVNTDKTVIDSKFLSLIGVTDKDTILSDENMVLLGYMVYHPQTIMLYNLKNSEKIINYIDQNRILFSNVCVKIWAQ